MPWLLWGALSALPRGRALRQPLLRVVQACSGRVQAAKAVATYIPIRLSFYTRFHITRLAQDAYVCMAYLSIYPSIYLSPSLLSVSLSLRLSVCLSVSFCLLSIYLIVCVQMKTQDTCSVYMGDTPVAPHMRVPKWNGGISLKSPDYWKCPTV